MKLKKYFWFFSCFTFFLLLSLGCSSSSEDEEDFSTEQKYEVELSILFEGNWLLTGPGNETGSLNPFIADYLKSGIVRHKIWIYKADDVSTGAIPAATLDLEKSLEEDGYDFTTSITLPAGDYVIKAWSDFRESSVSEPYYDLSKFPQIMLDHHSATAGYQDAFSGSRSFKVDKTATSINITMTRCLGRYIIISEDFSDLLEETGHTLDEVRMMASYTGFYPDTYSVITDRLTDSLTGEYYVMEPEVLSDGSAIMAADFMLMNSGGSSAGLQLRMFNKEGDAVASSEPIPIPMHRNEITVIKGKFLSTPSENEGGFDLDTGFDGDFNIKP